MVELYPPSNNPNDKPIQVNRAQAELLKRKGWKEKGAFEPSPPSTPLEKGETENES